MRKTKFVAGDKVYLTDSGRERFKYSGNALFVVLGVVDINGDNYYDIRDDKHLEKVYGAVEEEFLLSPEEALAKAPTPNLCNLSDALDCLEEKEAQNKTVNILGTDYRIVEKPIKECDGYCDKTTKEIAVAVKEDDCDLGNFEEYRKKVLRHEVIHAYHYESGLGENLENNDYGFSETLVDWFAYQSPKIFKTFEELGIL